ncbi:hypothetical protein EDC39_11078 [Geothermobacter ehrlichii]|uniref:Uncharacterized protein n=1 Tax=Geothermobacter ehrlichii TaxID=213224 RepID=A0A5D3WK83_9BACT|nr:hypothetical protein [Geothermobacter ehrlichii]TYO97538.1 hypothetical protein EDC39_11078 [Geothermobacter ehrlichii]
MKRILCLLIALPFILAPALALANGKDDKDKGNEVKLKMELEKEIEVEVEIEGKLTPLGTSSAVINNQQKLEENEVYNYKLENNATVDGNALQGASGNIGVNLAAGTNNAQDNLAAIASTEAEGSLVDAEIYKTQTSEENSTGNVGTTNNATLTENALQGANGNIGVNIVAGTGNAQSNMTAISVGPSSFGIASAGVNQVSEDNSTLNVPDKGIEFEGSFETGTMHLEGTMTLPDGRYEGTSDQIGDIYPDIWQGDSHGGGPQIGHFDLDDDVQGGSDLNDDGGALAFGESGKLFFDEDAEVTLDGNYTAFRVDFRCVTYPTTNTASLSGNALQGANGNIGVNVAAGTGNLQANGLAVSALLDSSLRVTE